MAVCKKDNKQASQIWERLDEADKQEVTKFCDRFQFKGRGETEQRVISFQGAAKLMMLLKGKVPEEFRTQASKIIERYMAGDASLVREIEANAQSSDPVAQLARASINNAQVAEAVPQVAEAVPQFVGETALVKRRREADEEYALEHMRMERYVEIETARIANQARIDALKFDAELKKREDAAKLIDTDAELAAKKLAAEFKLTEQKNKIIKAETEATNAQAEAIERLTASMKEKKNFDDSLPVAQAQPYVELVEVIPIAPNPVAPQANRFAPQEVAPQANPVANRFAPQEVAPNPVAPRMMHNFVPRYIAPQEVAPNPVANRFALQEVAPQANPVAPQANRYSHGYTYMQTSEPQVYSGRMNRRPISPISSSSSSSESEPSPVERPTIRRVSMSSVVNKNKLVISKSVTTKSAHAISNLCMTLGVTPMKHRSANWYPVRMEGDILRIIKDFIEKEAKEKELKETKENEIKEKERQAATQPPISSFMAALQGPL